MAKAWRIIPVNIAADVPITYPKTASNTPTGASAGWNAEATTGADAAPPTLACDPTAKKKMGAFMTLPTMRSKIA